MGSSLLRMSWLIALVFFASSGVQGTTGGPFEGRFVFGKDRLVLEQDVDRVRGALYIEGTPFPLRGMVTDGVLHATMVSPTGDAVAFQAKPVRQGLLVGIEGEDEPDLFLRTGTKGDRGPATLAEELKRQYERPRKTQRRSDSPKPQFGPAPPVSRTGPGAQGELHSAEHNGWSLHVPSGWTQQQQGALTMLHTATEPSLILVQAPPRVDPGGLERALRDSLAQIGVRSDTAPVRRTRLLEGAAALACEARGVASDGAPLFVRTVAVIGARRSVVIMGFTRPDPKNTAILRQRVDAVARTVRFFAPRVTEARRLVIGEWESGGETPVRGGRGTPVSVAFCSDGRFFGTLAAQSSDDDGGAGNATSAAFSLTSLLRLVLDPKQRQTPQWHVEGGANQGIVTVTRPDGRILEIPYRSVSGRSGVFFGDLLFLRRSELRRCR